MSNKASIDTMSIGVKAIVANHNLSLIGNMRGDSGDKLQIIHRLLLPTMPRILITNLASCLLKEEPLQTQQRADHVFTDFF